MYTTELFQRKILADKCSLIIFSLPNRLFSTASEENGYLFKKGLLACQQYLQKACENGTCCTEESM